MHRPRSAALGAALVLALLASACGSGTAPGRSSTAVRGSSGEPTPSAPTSASAASSPSPSPSDTTTARADARIGRLTAYLGHRGVSVAALDLTSGARFDYGADAGMLCGSIIKLYILEVLLLQHQRAGEPLDEDTDDLATRMIENSDNDAANDLYVDIGEGPALRRAAAALGVRNSRPGPGILWGFTRTSASDFLALLHDLVAPGALDARSRRYALRLTSHVEADQQWGVGTLGDAGTTTYLKNGWLPADVDGGRWLVNSVGIATVRGHRLLVAVLTQHGDSFDGGVALVGRLARIAAHTVIDR